MAMKEKPKHIDYDSIIDDLIQKIDNDESLFTLRDEFHDWGPTLTVIGLIIFFIFSINVFPDSVASTIQKITLSFALLAFLITFVSFTARGGKNNVVDANFGKAIETFKIEKSEREKRFLLEALLKIKVMNPSYELEIAKKMHPEMFTKENLLEKLYE